MSVLDTPRIYFRGQITWDPITNNNWSPFYDVSTSKPELCRGTVADYRERARQAILPLPGNWNVHGTHRSTFFETIVTGVDLGHGLQDHDALEGVPVLFTGKLVDLEPYGTTTSQLFFDELSCGIQGGSQILAHRAGPIVARRINVARNTGYHYIAGGASVIWQASFPTDGGLLVQPHGSAVLADLQYLLSHDDDVAGLTVRFNTYRTVYYGIKTPTTRQARALANRIAQGGFHPNPARSLIVGVIGLWRKGEAPSVPGDRVLARAVGSPVGTAFAKVGDGRLTIDLSNSIPETSFAMAKLNLGPLTVVAKAEGDDVELGTLEYAAYDTAAYQATSGIVTLPPLDPARAAAAGAADLEVRAADRTVLLTEQPLTVVADPPNLYLEEGEQASVSLRAFLRGGRPGAPVSVTIVQVGGVFTPLQVQTNLPPPQVQTNEAGTVTIPINGGKAGSWTWMLVPRRGDTAPTPPPSLDPDLNEYVVLRITPADDKIANLEPTWENVHHYVLRDWEALAPCMDNWLRLGDKQQCQTYAGLIRRLTSPERFNDYGYMPVTRDLTRGQRTLLHAWCDAVTESVTTRAILGAEDVAEKDPFGRGF